MEDLGTLRLRVTYQTRRFRREIAATLEHATVLGNASMGRVSKQYTHRVIIGSISPLLPIACVHGRTIPVENDSDERSNPSILVLVA